MYIYQLYKVTVISVPYPIGTVVRQLYKVTVSLTFPTPSELRSDSYTK